MRDRGVSCTGHLWKSLVLSYCKRRLVEEAELLSIEMESQGLPDKGWVLLNQMVERGIKLDTVTYHVMIRKYCKDKKSDCAMMLLDSMYRNGIAPIVHRRATQAKSHKVGAGIRYAKMSTRGGGQGGRGGRGMTGHGITAHGVTTRSVLTLAVQFTPNNGVTTRSTITPAVQSTPNNDPEQNSSAALHISESEQPNESLTPDCSTNDGDRLVDEDAMEY
ncbi:hypothetical protein RHMOL_Rhmol11G0101300 [Rhododendron molle]|uniref:Uncharacterized protein n=2 Tax=Rhododendron molle TaxID=49168 RepID=A0ACC0LQM7_RHOML|nr:hypothetical protein RHMOL_Rhmol11G0101300 [Rhododendron molle]